MLSFDKVYVGNVIYRDDSGSPSIFTTAIVIDLNGKLKNTVVGRIVIYPKENKILLLSDSREQIPYPADFDSLNAKRIYALRPIRKIIEAQALKPDASFEPAKSATEQLRRCRKAAEHIAR